MARTAAAQNGNRRKAAPRKGATTRRAPRQKTRQGARVPGWLCGLIGLIAGFALSQYFQQSAAPVATLMPKPATEAADATAASAGKAASRSQGESAAAKDEPAMPTFEFYTLLPESEVVAPKVDAYQSTPRPSDDDDGGAAQAAAKGGKYMLQAASFKDMADARRLAGKLKDFGLLAKITDVKANGDQTWHRVQVGPYEDTRELTRAQDLMVTQGIEPLMIRLQN
ncbi:MULTISPECIES: SPOR domain-containing protein [unclassified Modicisalibacter]|uniref:SPOR domain-containing protein n=1 Tax=unclassified Modicisalibacter TaxID=2679913 RepID=UPI001CCDF58F|nr:MULTISPECIES: SPOR domain-containing protein [unclassified Modicisalibacter]MBZ9558076.1 SPOR domain-containing protein [Modicisalibacter sp. R2A 31.J]MBZ9573255.1 SPOR domain-containing protein [Modicisalibacter sp. MOD 31.J]